MKSPLPAPHWAAMLLAREGACAKGCAPVTALLVCGRGTAVLQRCRSPVLCCAEGTALHHSHQPRTEAHCLKSHVPAILFARRNGDKTRRLLELVLKCCGFVQMQL